MLYKDNSRVETALKATMRYEFDAFGVNLQCCLSLLLPLTLGSCEFFFILKAMSIKLWTRVEFIETEYLLKKSAWRRQRNLVTVEVFENVCTKHFACSPALSPDNR